MTSVSLIGSTGQVGSCMLTTLIQLSSMSTVHSLSRRSPPSISDPSAVPNLKLHISPSDNWSSALGSLSTPAPSILFSGLGTTKAAAGSFDAQYAIDHDLNLTLAQAAHASGTSIYVLISAAGADSKSMIAYSKMKGQLEDGIKAIGFKKAIFLRPGLIVGQRDQPKDGLMESMLKRTAQLAESVAGHRAKDFWAQDADLIAKAAVVAGVWALEGKKGNEVGLEDGKNGEWVLSQADIVRLGRTNWDEFIKQHGRQSAET